MLPAQTPHQSQVVFSSRNKMAAVICELQTGDVLIVTAEDRQQLTCAHLNQLETQFEIALFSNSVQDTFYRNTYSSPIGY